MTTTNWEPGMLHPGWAQAQSQGWAVAPDFRVSALKKWIEQFRIVLQSGLVYPTSFYRRSQLTVKYKVLVHALCSPHNGDSIHPSLA